MYVDVASKVRANEARGEGRREERGMEQVLSMI
jgi:hypothetical protein